MDALIDELKERLKEPTPTWILAISFLVPYAIAYLVEIPNTRILRIGLWPVGMLAWVWIVLTVQFGPSRSPQA